MTARSVSPRRSNPSPRPKKAAADGSAPVEPTRREEIIAIARATCAQRGYTNTSMRDIAEASGLLAGSLYSHFRSKAEILRLILEPLLDQLVPAQEEVLGSDGSGLERLTRMVDVVFGILVEHQEEITILHYDWSVLATLDELTPVTARSNRLLELWRETIKAGIADGSIREDVHPDTAVRTITSALHASVDRKRYGVLPGLASDSVGVDVLSRQLRDIFSFGLAANRPAGNRSRRAKS